MSKKALIAAAFVMLCASGCSYMWNWNDGSRHGVSSSLVGYLYPDGQEPPELDGSVPYLELPLRVGVAFVPGRSSDVSLPEATKIRLLENVKAEFVDREYISSIEVIPDTYLRASKGVTGMQQVARLYDVDVMALVSYDQVAVSEENPAGLLYWTIVGSYLIKATSNEVQTFVDTAVFDVDTAKLLFRAPGADVLSDRSTLVEAGEVVRKGRQTSFGNAMDQMTVNLAAELDRFRERITTDPTVARAEWKPGSGGGGGLDWTFVLLMLGMVARYVPSGCKAGSYNRSRGNMGEDSIFSNRAQRSSTSGSPASM